MKKIIGCCVLMLLCHYGSALAAAKKNVEVSAAQKRVALVIGNKDYAVKPLRNPVNDARDMKAALEKIGFTVVYKENADLPEIDAVVHEFITLLNKDSLGLVYYSGHGAQVDDTNYLIPVRTATITNNAELKARAYDAQIILSQMEERGNPVNIVILDACRDNPFRNFRGGRGGLSSMIAPKGSLIAFATKPGAIAEDGSGANGAYTKYLKQYLVQPGLEIEEVFKKVREDVVKENPKQVPWENSSLMGNLCLAGCEDPLVKQKATELAALQAGKLAAQQAQQLALQKANELAAVKADKAALVAEKAQMAAKLAALEKQQAVQLATANRPQTEPTAPVTQQQPEQKAQKTNLKKQSKKRTNENQNKDISKLKSKDVKSVDDAKKQLSTLRKFSEEQSKLILELRKIQ